MEGPQLQLIDDPLDRHAARSCAASLCARAEFGQIQRCHRRILAHRPRNRQAFGDAVRREVAYASPRAPAATEAQLPRRRRGSSRRYRFQPENSADDFGFAATDQPRDAGDLARAGIESDIVHTSRRQGEMVDLKQLPGRAVSNVREQQPILRPVISSTSSVSIPRWTQRSRSCGRRAAR